MTEDRDLLRQRLIAMSPRELSALNKAIRDRGAAALAKCRKVSPNALQRFEQKIKDYPLEGKTAWVEPHRDFLRIFVVKTYECGNDVNDLSDLNNVRFQLSDKALTRQQTEKLLKLAVAWLRQLDLVCSVRSNKQLNGLSGKTETPHPLDKFKPL